MAQDIIIRKAKKITSVRVVVTLLKKEQSTWTGLSLFLER